MSLPLLHLPVEVVEQIVACLSDASKRSLALALAGRPRPGENASEQHVRALQRLLLPTKIYLDTYIDDLSPESLPESVRLQANHLHIECELCRVGSDEDIEQREDGVAMMQRLADMMWLSWPEVVEVTVHLSAAAVAAPLSLVMFRLPALQRLTVMGGRGTGRGLAGACRIIANLGTRLESLEMYDLSSGSAADVSTVLSPLTSLTGLQRLVVEGHGQGLASPLDDLLAPLTRLTALQLECDACLPANLAQLTALRELKWDGWCSLSQLELHSVLSPLTQLTALSLSVFSVDGSCGLPELPGLQSIDVHEVADGGLALLAASCPALVSLTTSRCTVTANTKDAAARLPALTSLTVSKDLQPPHGSAAGFSLAGCAPALKSLSVTASTRLIRPSPIVLVDKLTGLRELELCTQSGLEPWVMGAREWQALAALPALRSFVGSSIHLGEGTADMAACVSVCARLTRLGLRLRVSDSQVRCCVALVAAMRCSRVQAFDLTWGLDEAGGACPDERFTPFWEHLASWQCLSHARFGFVCTAEQLSVLCANPTVTRIELSPPDDLDAAEAAHLSARARQLEQAHRAKELDISMCGLL